MRCGKVVAVVERQNQGRRGEGAPEREGSAVGRDAAPGRTRRSISPVAPATPR